MLFVIAVAFFECYCEQHILVRRHRNDLRLGQDMIASTQLATNLSMPVLDIPLEALCRDVGSLFERNDTNMLAEGIFLSLLSNLDLMTTSLEQECQT